MATYASESVKMEAEGAPNLRKQLQIPLNSGGCFQREAGGLWARKVSEAHATSYL